MKKYIINGGWRAYDYKGYTIVENQYRAGERKYYYKKDGEIIGYARTLELAKSNINYYL